MTTINDSVRVIGESEGDVTVLEVAYHTDTKTVKNDQTKRKELMEELNTLESQVRDVKAALGRLESQNSLVDVRQEENILIIYRVTHRVL